MISIINENNRENMFKSENYKAFIHNYKDVKKTSKKKKINSLTPM